MTIEDINQAKRELRLGVALLHGRICQQTFKNAAWDATTIRRRLKDNGFTKMADTLSVWIGKAYNNGAFL